jgi:hypothetical protein
VLARGASRFVLGYPSRRGGVYPPRYGRIAVVAALALGVEALLLVLGPTLPRGVSALAHHGMLTAAGAALARWCVSSERSPAWLSTGLVVLGAAVSVRRFELVPSVAHVFTRLPADASVAWAAWHIAAVRGRIAGGDDAAHPRRPEV